MNVAIIDEGDLSHHRKPGHLQSLSWTRSSTAVSLVGGIHSSILLFIFRFRRLSFTGRWIGSIDD